MSSRTLQRRLQDAGFSFQRVLEEARHRLARHYLNNPALELNEAAYLLGNEERQFFRSCFPDLGRSSASHLARTAACEGSNLTVFRQKRRNHAKTQTGKKQSGSLGHGPGLHEPELRLRARNGEAAGDFAHFVQHSIGV
jgi:hypothetical protein